MINLALPEPLMLALRWALLLGPLALVLFMVRYRELPRRTQVAGLFAFLYGISMVFVTHSIALYFDWWHYGWDALMLNGLPADIMVGGAVLFGPGLYFTFPRTAPLMICLPIIIGLHGTVFSSLEPLVIAGPNWFLGVLFVFATAHIPAIYLAKWTEEDRYLPLRCALLAIMTGGLIFAILPALIMQEMGGTWDLLSKPFWSYALTLPLLTLTSVIGLSANQVLCLQGKGTPIPLDPTKRLVRTGIYAYVSNPMQLSAALSWLVLGLFLQNIWIMGAALMAWVFVQGMVRWHHRHDLLKRFPKGWPNYKENVPEWIPRWTPWTPNTATLHLATDHRALRRLLRGAKGLTVQQTEQLSHYENPDDVTAYSGTAACLMALTHINFAWTVFAYTALIPLLGLAYLAQALRSRMP
ncbi:methyltransferase family protein [Planktotalea sp.]|uniref:methyltransferase family protein n=1 Tax=Planktotalea sp. TaxID=2029877 RepID=UPI003D6B620A